jgi:hypothetical protein
MKVPRLASELSTRRETNRFGLDMDSSSKDDETSLLDSCSWFGECFRRWLLHEIVKDAGSSDGDNEDDQASDGKHAHFVFSLRGAKPPESLRRTTDSVHPE